MFLAVPTLDLYPKHDRLENQIAQFQNLVCLTLKFLPFSGVLVYLFSYSWIKLSRFWKNALPQVLDMAYLLCCL